MRKLLTSHRWASFLGAVVFLLVPLGASGQAQKMPVRTVRKYRLRLYELHTGERIDIVYRRGNDYIAPALKKLDYFLRDYRTGTMHHFDPHVYDLLSKLTAAVGRPGAEIDVVCGYRTPWTNRYLRTHTPGVALHSLHMEAEAVDLRISGVPTSEVREAALALHLGGVGYYPHSNFVHVDIGRVRRWCFECTTQQNLGD